MPLMHRLFSRLHPVNSYRASVFFMLLFGIVGWGNAPQFPTEVEPSDRGAPPMRCQDDYIIGIGHACRQSNGLLTIRLEDGTIVETHGHDGFEVALPETPSESHAFAPTQTCVTALTSDYHGLLVYVYPSDHADNSSVAFTTMQTYFQSAQAKLQQEFQEFGQTGSYKMACNADASLRIDKIRLSTPLATTTFSSVMNDLSARGYSSNFAKYWIYMDVRPPGMGCGIGGVRTDDSASVANLNNSGRSYALSMACNAFMHENGHNLGAVQHSASNASGGWHCNDGRDIMCYADGGSSSDYNAQVCTDRVHYDCNHDDYFHPHPAPSSYLATHWNIAACYNRFIVRSGCAKQSVYIPLLKR